MSYKVVVSDTKVMDGETRAAVLDAVDATVETIAAKEPEAVARAVDGADALIVDAGTQVTAEVIEPPTRSKWWAGPASVWTTSPFGRRLRPA